MPELPEVEITTKNLQQIILADPLFKYFKFFRKDLRHPLPIKDLKNKKDLAVRKIFRRAKFIVFELDEGIILNHLGMTGSWRVEHSNYLQKTHDHIEIGLSQNRALVFNDPRRFGEFNFLSIEDFEARMKKFGPEPLDSTFDLNTLTASFKRINTCIKVALMNQKNIVGVGNIYASEALFRAGVRPSKPARLVTLAQYQKLWSVQSHVFGPGQSHLIGPPK